jgi:tRNA threonylcarbamoyladenosine biosynthesis protein TsaE
VSVTLQTESAEATVALGRRLARQLKPGDVVLLHGDLGSGKTTLAQGMLAGLGVTSPVPSPTFTLVNEYDGVTAVGESVRLYHLDLYRLASGPDLDSIGLDDYLAPTDGIAFIEWPERAVSRFDGAYLLIEIATAGDQRRDIRVSPLPAEGERFPWLSDIV